MLLNGGVSLLSGIAQYTCYNNNNMKTVFDATLTVCGGSGVPSRVRDQDWFGL